MRVKVDVNDERNYYSNDDTVSAEITLHKDDAEEKLDVKSLRVSLVCEGVVTTENGVFKRFRYFTSPSVIPTLEKGTLQLRKYNCRVTFPCEGSEYPSTLHFDDANDGIQWFLYAEATTESGAAFHGKHICTFAQSGPLPSLLSLVDIEHAETIERAQVALITSHATAGLPQSPLSAGIGLCIECSEPNAFTVKRLRLLLNDTTEVSFGAYHKFLPPHRWLLSSTVIEPPIRLQSTANLDKYTRDVQIDHASLPHSFDCNEFTHSFDLVVEVTLESTTTGKSRKVISLSPVVVLPRIAHTFDADELSRTTSSEIAYITDSSDEDVDENTNDDDADVDEIPSAFTQSHKQTRPFLQSSSPSSESIKSIFSDHTTKLDLDVGVQALSLS